MKKKPFAKRRNVTLIEMMIVMFLIALITGVVAFNYTGSMDKGKAFKTEQAINRIENILNMKLAEEPSFADSISLGWKDAVMQSPLVQNPSAFLHDGWNGEYIVSMDNGVVKVTSAKLEEYKSKNAK